MISISSTTYKDGVSFIKSWEGILRNDRDTNTLSFLQDKHHKTHFCNETK